VRTVLPSSPELSANRNDVNWRLVFLLYTNRFIVIIIIIIIIIINLILNSLKFRTHHSRQRHLDTLFLINVFKGKINCPSILGTVGIRVLTRQIREFSTFSVSSALKHTPSARCVIAANGVCRYMDIFHKNNIYFQGTFFWMRNCLDTLISMKLTFIFNMLLIVYIY
jgi:hypothetical protein